MPYYVVWWTHGTRSVQVRCSKAFLERLLGNIIRIRPWTMTMDVFAAVNSRSLKRIHQSCKNCNSYFFWWTNMIVRETPVEIDINIWHVSVYKYVSSSHTASPPQTSPPPLPHNMILTFVVEWSVTNVFIYFLFFCVCLFPQYFNRENNIILRRRTKLEEIRHHVHDKCFSVAFLSLLCAKQTVFFFHSSSLKKCVILYRVLLYKYMWINYNSFIV